MNAVSLTLNEFATSAGFDRQPGGWCRRQRDTTAVLELQRSNYGPAYYANLGIWLSALGADRSPRERFCHLRTRLTSLLPQQAGRISALLDLSYDIKNDERRSSLLAILNDEVLPIIDSCATLESVRSLASMGRLDAFLITGAAHQLIYQLK